MPAGFFLSPRPAPSKLGLLAWWSCKDRRWLSWHFDLWLGQDTGARCCAIRSRGLHLVSENHCFPRRPQNQILGGRRVCLDLVECVCARRVCTWYMRAHMMVVACLCAFGRWHVCACGVFVHVVCVCACTRVWAHHALTPLERRNERFGGGGRRGSAYSGPEPPGTIVCSEEARVLCQWKAYFAQQDQKSN